MPKSKRRVRPLAPPPPPPPATEPAGACAPPTAAFLALLSLLLLALAAGRASAPLPACATPPLLTHTALQPGQQQPPPPQQQPPPPAPPTAAAPLHAYARQCGQDFTSGMPLGTLFSPAAAATAACPSLAALQGALANATRGPPPVPWAERADGDGRDDGALVLGGGASGACQLRWFSPPEACALLAQMGGMVLVGDSLVRHAELALRQVLAGNWAVGGYLGGALPVDDIDRLAACRCDAGYGKFWACHALPSDPGVGRFRATCPNWPAGAAAPRRALPPLQYLAYWSGGWNDGVVRELLASFAADADEAAAAEGGGSGGGGGSAPLPRPVLLVEIGPAWDENWVPAQEGMVAQLAAAAAAARDLRARLVCMLVLAPDEARKPEYVRARQSDAVTRAVNEYVRSACSAAGGVVLDAYALTKGAWTRDGTHYEGRTNTMLAQALLNIAAM
jgi:hypothetical protein